MQRYPGLPRDTLRLHDPDRGTEKAPQSQPPCLRESVENQEKWGRYTFLGYNPKLELTCTNGELTVKDVVTGKTETSHQAHPAAYIKELMKKYTSPKLEGFPSFTGGLVGYFSYDYIKYSEPTLNLDAKDEERFKDVDLMLFDKVMPRQRHRRSC
ncbi:MAG: hypothetical protein ACLVFU_01145 [Eggerthellaceae bacterium]